MLPSAYGQHFQDLGHSFSPYGLPSRQITYIYLNFYPILVIKQSDDKRNTIDDTPLNDSVFCVTQLSEGWYRFVAAVGTRTPTTFVDSYKCGKANLSWLTLWLPEAINLLLLPAKSIHYPGKNTQTYQEEVVYLI